MSFQTALSNLADLSVSGIVHNYGIDSVPESLHRAQLPALLVLPLEAQNDSLFQEGGEAFEAVAFSDGTKTVEYVTTHLLIIAPAKRGKGLREHLPLLVTCIDNYFTTLGADVTLNDALELAANVRVEPTLYTIGDTQYIACSFRHRWIIAV